MVLLLHKKEAKGPPNLYLTLAMVLSLFVDSFGQVFGFWTSTNDLRLITGLLFGTALEPMLIYALTIPPIGGGIPLLKNIQPRTAVLDDRQSWFDAKTLGLGLLLSAVLFLIIRSLVNPEFFYFYWVLSIPIVLEIVLHFFVLPFLLLIVTARRLLRKE
jgi:hypothetical protein